MKEVIEFKKQRDIGAVITDTFKFIRLEGKELGLIILKVSGPAMLVLIVSYIYYVQSTLGDFERIFTAPTFFSNTVLSALLLAGSYIAFYALLYGAVFGYIKNYIETKGNVNPEEVSQLARNYFWSYTGLSILVGLITGIGFVLCILPGIFFGVCLSLTLPMLMFDQKDVGGVISKSFRLIKDEWWITFATLLVIYILYYIIAIIFQLPQIIYYLTKMFVMMEEVSGNPFEIIDWVSITLDIFSMVAQYFLFGLILIAVAFVYFNLNEKKNFTGALETIDSLGERDGEV